MFCPDAGFIGVMILLPIFEANANFHIDLFVIVNSKVYTYIYIYALDTLGLATVISAKDMRVQYCMTVSL